MQFKSTLALLPLVLLTACGMFSNNYVKPSVVTPLQWSDNQLLVHSTESNFSVASLAWWKKFNDPQLNQLIESALANNNDIGQATVNIQTAQDALSVVQSQWVPSINLSAGNFTGNLPPLAENSTFNWLGFGLHYNLNILQIIRQQKLAKLNIQLQQATLNGIRLAIISETAATYFNLITAREQLALCKQSLNDLAAQQQYLTTQYQKGLISKLEIDQSQIQLSELDAKLPLIETNITNLQNALQVLLNHNPGKFNTNLTLAQINTLNILPKSVPMSAIEQRPDIIIADYNLKIAAEKIGIAYSQLFPSIDIFAPLGVENGGNISGGNFFASTWWFSLVQGNMNLLDKAAYDNIDQSKSQYKAQSYTYLQTVKSAFAQVDDGLAWQQNSLNSLANYNQAKLNASATYQLAMSRYKLGAISYADTLNYKLQLDAEQDKYDTAKQAHISSLINLYLVLGSGYLATNEANTKQTTSNKKVS